MIDKVGDECECAECADTTDPAPAGLDIDALRRLAEAATPGPWRNNDDTTISVYVEPEKGHSICNIPVPYHDWSKRDCQARRDAAFIAAWNPATALALLDELERVLEPFTEAWNRVEAVCEQMNSGLPADEQQAFVKTHPHGNAHTLFNFGALRAARDFLRSAKGGEPTDGQ